MTRKIYIEFGVLADEAMSIVYEPTFINTAGYTMTFVFHLYVDGRKALVKTFRSRYRDWDMGDEKTLAEKILQNLYSTGAAGIYDVPNPREQVGDELIIEFSPQAKEMFEFLSKYKQRLLEVML